jgi:transcriptional regulator with XRE-family HTH domain
MQKKAKRKFDYGKHNKKIAKLRGENWQKALVKAKFDAVQKPSLMKLRRVKMGLSQKNLLSNCPAIGSITALRKIENAEHKASYDKAFQISKALKCKLSELFVLKGNKYLVKGESNAKPLGKPKKKEAAAKFESFTKAKTKRPSSKAA